MSNKENEFKVGILIFSKDRACQLDLMLRSFFEKFKLNYSLRCLYTTSSEFFEEGYTKLKSIYPIEFIKESDKLSTHVINIVGNMKEKFVTFLVDDVIFVREFVYDNVVERFITDESICTLMYRVSPTLKRNFNTDTNLIISPKIGKDNVYDWTICKDIHWIHPMTVCGHIYRQKEISDLIHKVIYNFGFENINELEDYIVKIGTNKIKMICTNTHKLVEICLNRVQDTHTNPCGVINTTTLNHFWLTGNRLSIDFNKLAGDFIRIKDLDYEYYHL